MQTDMLHQPIAQGREGMDAMTAIDPADNAAPTKHKRRRRPPAVEIEADTPIWCPSCKAMRVAADFGIERRRFSGLKTRCRACEAAARQTTGSGEDPPSQQEALGEP